MDAWYPYGSILQLIMGPPLFSVRSNLHSNNKYSNKYRKKEKIKKKVPWVAQPAKVTGAGPPLRLSRLAALQLLSCLGALAAGLFWFLGGLSSRFSLLSPLLLLPRCFFSSRSLFSSPSSFSLLFSLHSIPSHTTLVRFFFPFSLPTFLPFVVIPELFWPCVLRKLLFLVEIPPFQRYPARP